MRANSEPVPVDEHGGRIVLDCANFKLNFMTNPSFLDSWVPKSVASCVFSLEHWTPQQQQEEAKRHTDPTTLEARGDKMRAAKCAPAVSVNVRKGGNAPVVITRDLLAQSFHLPTPQAARKMGLGLTAFKHVCRRFGIRWWPYRAMVSFDQLLAKAKGSGHRFSKADVEDIVAQRDALVRGDISKIPKVITVMRQVVYKADFNRKRRQSP